MMAHCLKFQSNLLFLLDYAEMLWYKVGILQSFSRF